MLTMIHKQLDYLIHLGIDNTQHSMQSKRVSFCNKLTLAFIAASIPFVSVFFIFGFFKIGSIAFPFIALFWLSLFLNHKKHYRFAKLALLTGIMIPVFIYSVLLGPESGIPYVFFICTASIFGLFSPSEQKERFVLGTLPILCFFSLDFFTFQDYRLNLESFHYMHFIYWVAITLIFFILYINGLFYTGLAEKYEKESLTLQHLYGLTPRENEIIQFIADGKSNKDIAKLCFIEEGTVKNHLHKIYTKTKTKGRLDLLSLVMKNS